MAGGMSDDRVKVSVDEAVKRLRVIPDYDPGDGPGSCVHTYRDVAGMLLGAHHKLDRLLVRMEQYGVEEAGPGAVSAMHGLVVIDDRGPLFLETI